MSMIPDVQQNEAIEIACTNEPLLLSYVPAKTEDPLLLTYVPTKTEDPLSTTKESHEPDTTCESPFVSNFMPFLDLNQRILKLMEAPFLLSYVSTEIEENHEPDNCELPLVSRLTRFLESTPNILKMLKQMAKGTKKSCDGFIEVANHARMLVASAKHKKLNPSVRECQSYVKCSKNTLKLWIKRFLGQKNTLAEFYENEERLKQEIIKVLTFSHSKKLGRPSEAEACTSLIDSVLCVEPNTLANLNFKWISPELQAQLKGRSIWTLELLSKLLHHSVSTVSSYLKRLNISLSNQGTEKWPRCFSYDPNYIPKTLAIHLAYLYAEQMGYVLLCFDEKPNIQALKTDSSMAAQGKITPNDRYERKGTASLLALYRPSTGQAICAFEKNKTAKTEVKFLSSALEQYKDKKVLIIMDNLNVHGSVQQQLFDKYHNVSILYTASNASWQNAVESFFSRVSRSFLKHRSFASIEELQEKAKAFFANYNEHPSPFHWSLDIKRHFNQVANTLRTLKSVFGDLGDLKSWDSKILDDAYSSLIPVTNKAAQSIKLDFKGLTSVKSNASQVTSLSEEHLFHGVPSFNCESWSLNQDNKDDVLEFSQRVMMALLDPVKAMDLVREELLQYSEKPSRKESNRLVTQKEIDKVAEKVQTYTASYEAAKTAEIKEKFKLKLEFYLDKLKQLQQKFSEQLKAKAHVNNEQNQLDKQLQNRLDEAGKLYYENLRWRGSDLFRNFH